MQKDDSTIDLDELKKLLMDFNKLELSSSHISRIYWPIYRFNDNLWERDSRIIFIHSKNSETISNPVVQELLDFIINNTTPGMTNDESVKYELYNNLEVILFAEFNKNELRRAVENKNADEPCNLSKEQLLNVVEKQVGLYKYKKLDINKVKLVSTLCPIEMHDIDELIFFQNENLNIKIKKWNKTERALFASKYAYKVSWELDIKFPMDTATFVEVEYIFSKDKYTGSRNKLQQYLFGILDLIKWMFMVLSNNPYPIREGTCILETYNPHKIDVVRRDTNFCTIPNNSNFIIKPEMRDKFRELIKDYYNTSNQFNDLKDALWFFGRACVDNLERDRLIDSVIGLEIILVQGHQQLGYQFRLHGATIFSTQWDNSKINLFEGEKELFWKKEELVKWFRELYSRRSSSVHGANNEYSENDVLPALYALAVIIKGIVYLNKKGLLPEDNKELSKAVQNYIIMKSVLKNDD
ncbi:HEPN domain-containing protein [Methanobacterium ferruginis]|uniref:HEPN domain-containing protein n=1 Tax=Methanobacterium ferruginis TaxID=710191 RepID=UPI00257260FD|nr:HEPN domain-containing protein [Methanobacterium ferruginis]BDZ68273.1 hypothetical protein GCM10025860_17210 [Methanobacterium ferruginis]